MPSYPRTSTERKTWRVLTATSALAHRNTSVRLQPKNTPHRWKKTKTKIQLRTRMKRRANFKQCLRRSFYMLAITCALLGLPTVQAATITVTNNRDSGPGSLRQALADAHNEDIISFDPSLNGQTITLTSGELVVNGILSINGPGPRSLAIDAN